MNGQNGSTGDPAARVASRAPRASTEPSPRPSKAGSITVWVNATADVVRRYSANPATSPFTRTSKRPASGLSTTSGSFSVTMTTFLSSVDRRHEHVPGEVGRRRLDGGFDVLQFHWVLLCGRSGRSDGEQGLDRAALVHRPVALGGLVQRQGEVEDAAGVDGAVADELDQVGQEAADRGGTAVQVHLGEDQLVAGQRDVVGDADVADVPAGAGGPDGLQ